MKKKIALLLGVLVLMTAVFAACSTTPTTRAKRWAENQKYTFNITLADLGRDNAFNSYNYSDAVYYKDTAVTLQEANIFASTDEVRPVAAAGTYTMSLTLINTTTYKLITDQVLYSQYETETLQQIDCLALFKDYVVAPTDEENPFSENEGRTTLRSTNHTEVEFSEKESQYPLNSLNQTDGYYLGKTHQNVFKHDYKTVYDFENQTATVTVDNGEAEERKLKLSKGAACLDASQLLVYLRSLDKSSVAFQDSPSVAVYDPISDTLATATFGLTRNFNAILNNKGTEVYTKVDSVGVIIGSTPFLSQFNLPDRLANVGEGFDVIATSSAESKLSKFTTVKFRRGWYSYEIADYDSVENGIIDALTAKEEK